MEIIGSLIISISQSILFYGKEIGISMIIFILIANGIIGYILNRKNKIKNKKAFLLMIPIMLLASTYFIFSNTIFHIANFGIIILLNLLMYLIATDKKKYFMDYIYSIYQSFFRFYKYFRTIQVKIIINSIISFFTKN